MKSAMKVKEVDSVEVCDKMDVTVLGEAVYGMHVSAQLTGLEY